MALISGPDTSTSSPQILNFISPLKTTDGIFGLVQFNHRGAPDFRSGGVQVQGWIGTVLAGYREDTHTATLNRSSDNLRYTVAMEKTATGIRFQLLNGRSRTWGRFATTPVSVTVAVDFGLINVTKGQIQNAADSAALAAMQELVKGIGPGATVSSNTAKETAGEKAKFMVQQFPSGDVSATNLSVGRDVRFGRRSWDPVLGRWIKEWDTTPCNMVEVTVRRTRAADAPLGSVFARVFGFTSFDLEARSVAAVAPVTGFRLPSGSSSTIALLPIALDLTTWNNLVTQIVRRTNHGFQDRYRYNSLTEAVSSTADGTPEVDIYPAANSNMPSGNRGTVDIGSPNNSTADLKRQIQFGINAADLSYFPNGELKFDSNGVLYLNGDTGISAGIESALETVIGETAAMPIFIDVSGPGNNAQYTIVKFVGVRIMAVKLSGGPTQRCLYVQPASYSSSFTTRGAVSVNVDTMLSQPLLIE